MDMVDWQSNKTFAETNKYMWTHKIDCDVTFLVGKEEEKVNEQNNCLNTLKQFIILFWK